jgi:sugar phosphate isomerase/epimerase
VHDRRFGVSTQLFLDSRLTLAHLVEISASGIEAVEVFGSRSHFDYSDAGTVDALGHWLSEARLDFHSLHAPTTAMTGSTSVGVCSTASGDEAERRAAVAEAKAALDVARIVPYRCLVVRLGVPGGAGPRATDNQPGAARRSLQEIADLAQDVGVEVAVEMIPNPLSSPDALVHLLEEEPDLHNVGICLDFGHAHVLGDVVDTIETISGHLIATHVHDNMGRRDDHLVPGAGTIDWEAAIMATQKVGYDGVVMFDTAGGNDPADVLRRCAGARRRLDRMFVTF